MDDLLAVYVAAHERAQRCHRDAAHIDGVGDAELAAIERRAAELFEALAAMETQRYELTNQRTGVRR